MLRTIALAVLAGTLASAAAAAPQNQLVAPNFNPGLRTVPFVPQGHSVRRDDGACERQLVARIDSGTVIAGADGRVAHVTGMGIGRDAELMIVSTAADGLSASAEFVACVSPSFVTPAPMAASLPLAAGQNMQSITVRAQANAIVLDAKR